MKTHRVWGPWLGALLLWGAAGTAQATLIGVLPTTNGGTDYQGYYDSATNLTWLANADANGAMTWSDANTWAAGLGVTGYVGSSQINVTGWTLPSIVDTGTSGCNFAYSGTDCGYNVQTTSGSTVYSAMASLYYDTLGNMGYYDTSGNPTGCSSVSPYCLTNTGPFTNVQSSHYWSATEYAPNTDVAWDFGFSNGVQGANVKADSLYAWAVHSGNVGDATLPGASVPEPGTLWLTATGLLGLAARRRLALR